MKLLTWTALLLPVAGLVARQHVGITPAISPTAGQDVPAESANETSQPAPTLSDEQHGSLVNLERRIPYPPITEANWELAVNEGCNLHGAMLSEDGLAASFFQGAIGTIQSQYRTYPQDLRDWGYRVQGQSIQDFHDYAGPDVYTAMTALGIDYRMDTEQGATVCDAWEHSAQTVVGQTTYQPTRALFASIFNVDYGLMIGWHKFGPAFMGPAQNPPVTLLPQLKRWSDIAFLGWQYQAQRRGRDGSDLRYIVSADITNTETGPILQRCLGVPDVKARCRQYRWANRREWNWDTDEFKAIISSPNGRGAALMLIQHKYLFGQRSYISKASMWCGGNELHLMYHVVRQN